MEYSEAACTFVSILSVLLHVMRSSPAVLAYSSELQSQSEQLACALVCQQSTGLTSISKLRFASRFAVEHIKSDSGPREGRTAAKYEGLGRHGRLEAAGWYREVQRFLVFGVRSHEHVKVRHDAHVILQGAGNSATEISRARRAHGRRYLLLPTSYPQQRL